MAFEIICVIFVDQEDIPDVVLQGHLEVTWATNTEAICLAFPSRVHWEGNVLALLFNTCLQAWPITLLRRLAWGDMPHYGDLGGISGWRMEALLDSLDHVMAETVRRTGRTVWTDLAWRRIATLGTAQRCCPDCGQSGPDGQMAHYGAIWACDLCLGVSWGAGVYH